jgi:hypothetical protein
VTEIRHRAGDLRRDALTHLSALAGNASMCAIGRSGRSFPAAKYHEGRAAAAAQVVRSRAADPVASVRSEWAAMLERSASLGSDWQAYASGGLDALAELEPGTPTQDEAR